jgi:hypothetical protein
MLNNINMKFYEKFEQVPNFLEIYSLLREINYEIVME